MDELKFKQLQTKTAENLESAKSLLLTAEIMQCNMNDILDFALIRNNCFWLNEKYFNLLTLIEQSFVQLDYISQKKNITFVRPSLSDD